MTPWDSLPDEVVEDNHSPALAHHLESKLNEQMSEPLDDFDFPPIGSGISKQAEEIILQYVDGIISGPLLNSVCSSNRNQWKVVQGNNDVL